MSITENDKLFADNLNKDVNEILTKLEDYRNKAKKLNNKSLAKLFRTHLDTGLSNLLVLSDITFEIGTCETEDEISYLIDANTVCENTSLPAAKK